MISLLKLGDEPPAPDGGQRNSDVTDVSESEGCPQERLMGPSVSTNVFGQDGLLDCGQDFQLEEQFTLAAEHSPDFSVDSKLFETSRTEEFFEPMRKVQDSFFPWPAPTVFAE
jgi:hypothetical protein